jgi:phage gpG-like protein
MNPELRIEVQVLQDTFRIETAAMEAFLRGPLVADLVKRAIRVEAAAKRNATGEGEGPRVRTGRLRASIGYRIGADSVSPYVDIGTSVHYAPFVEFGHNNRAHAYPIYTPGGKFTGRFGYVTNKPTRPFPFLRPAAEAARTT